MAQEIKNSIYMHVAMQSALDKALEYRNPFLTPEHLVRAIITLPPVVDALVDLDIKVEHMVNILDNELMRQSHVPEDMEFSIDPSAQFERLIVVAMNKMSSASQTCLEVTHVLRAAMELKDSLAGNLIDHYAAQHSDFFSEIISKLEEYADMFPVRGNNVKVTKGLTPTKYIGLENYERVDPLSDSEQMSSDQEMEGLDFYTETLYGEDQARKSRNVENSAFVTCLNDHLKEHNPLIGRETELERTIHVLCRKDKNNPLHVGEPGVGKTALVYGLAQRIEDGNVPDTLLGFKIYQLDMAGMVAGTQYRGDFEKRFKQTMEQLEKLEKAIVYIDEIHTIVGAGATGDSAMDASNMLKPYLEGGKLRFIGSTTYEELNRQLSRSKGIVRRFQQIDILEPSVEETIEIVNGLKAGYEEFHKVKYAPSAIDYAVKASAKHITGRFLPDKAIDLIDEAGAFRHIHPTNKKRQTVDRALIDDVLMKVMKIKAAAMKEDNNQLLKSLEKRIKSFIYGQDRAVREVVEAVQLSKAGLIEDGKPLASLLFVGPTGVGKTEVARVLARELGVELVRFDMSEYTEKHTVAKLIGSPAGYVGYEDGGLLTDAIRKTPNCVLLLDEIEKAHEDIYNILLQVMDYATLADNKGRRADFRNVVLIMTSNAGAQYAGMSVGFDSNGSRGGDMLKQVKKTFKPEFINRLSDIVVFNDMDETMAGMILDKKLRELQAKLESKKVTLKIDAEARAFLLTEGFTPEYGARELDRVLHREIKTKLMREILFGKLKRGGTAHISLTDGKITLK